MGWGLVAVGVGGASGAPSAFKEARTITDRTVNVNFSGRGAVVGLISADQK